jgi:hypothetical protein
MSWEDSPAFEAADITGVRDPISTGQQPKPPPQPKAAPPPPAPPLPAIAQEPKAGTGDTSVGPPQKEGIKADLAPEQPLQPPPENNPYAPIDWGAAITNDAHAAYHSARNTFDLLGAFMRGTGAAALPGDAVRNVERTWSAADDNSAISQSIQNIWEQDNAGAALARYLLSGQPSQAIAPTKTGEQQASTIGGTAVSIGANPLNALGMGSGSLAARLALTAGPQVAQAVGEQNGNSTATDLGWAALTGAILGRGHLPPGASQEITKTLGSWPAVEQTVKSILGLQRDYKADMASGSQAATGAVQDYFQKGGFEGNTSLVAKGTTPVRGEIVQKGTSPLLTAAGVSSVPEFLQKAGAEGIPFTKAVQAQVDHYGDLGLRHDLMRVNPADVALGNPDATLRDLHNLGDPVRTAGYLESMNHFDALAGHVQSGLWAADATGKNAAQAMLNNVAGHNRPGGSTDILYGSWLNSIEKLMKTQGINGGEVSKAITGDADAFAKLSPEGQGIARQWRVFGNALMRESATTKYSDNFRGNWLPFRFEKTEGAAPKGGQRVGAFPGASQAHKTEAIKADAQGNLVVAQRFNSPQEANTQFGQMRQGLISELTNATTPLRDELSKSKWANDIRTLASTDPGAAMTQAKQAAQEYYPNFETDFLRIARNWNASGLKAMRSHQALQTFAESTAADGRPLVVTAADVAAQHGLDTKDYLPLPGKQYQNYLFHPDFHPNIERYVDNARKGLANVAPFKQALDIEGKAVASIMFSPPIHMLNMGARFGSAWAMNPLEMTHYLLNGKALSPMQQDAESNALRKFAIEAGGIPPTRGGHSMFDNLSARGNDALANVDDQLEQINKDDPNLGQKFIQSHKMLNDWIWNHYRDFGTMMTHLEYIGARKHGMGDTEAKLFAGRRGASWTGLANPENESPALHDAMRGVALAPGYWMSFAQLMVPYYRRAGLSAKDAPYMAYQGAKFIAAAWAFQHLTGNLANFLMTSSSPTAMDGHFQNQNLPGNQDRIEATAPWLDHLPGFSGVAANDPKTGGRRTMENPLGRQMRDLETAAGLESGHPDWQPSDVQDGVTKALVARISPLLTGMGGLVNVDPYRSATTGTWAHVDPTQPGGPSVLSPLYALLMMSPLGVQYAEKVAASMSSQKAFDVSQGPFGLTVPKAMTDIATNSTTALDRVAYTWLTGTNPPYDYAAKSAGTPVSDAEYQKWKLAQTDYRTKMTAASTKALGGEMTPAEWLTGTKDGTWAGQKSVSADYHTISASTFHNAPHYVNGSEGLLNEYESLYDQATVPDSEGGGVDYAKLDQLRAAFDAKHANDPQAGQMQSILQQNDTRFPMQALYHKTIDAYGKWQESFAQHQGIDINTLRQEISAHNALYSNRAAATAYLGQHKVVAAYDAAKRTQFEQSPAGLMYGLFYDSSVVARYMQAKHLNAQQLESEVAAEP